MHLRYVTVYKLCMFLSRQGAQWLSGRALDQIHRDRGFEPHRRHCVVSLSKPHLSLLRTGSTQEDPSRQNWRNIDWDVKNQIKHTNKQTKKNKVSVQVMLF